jgi:hypothetical protein
MIQKHAKAILSRRRSSIDCGTCCLPDQEFGSVRAAIIESGRQAISCPSSDYLLRNDWLSSLIGALLYRLGWSEAPQGIAPCRVVCSAGLRWCGGWRRTNLRGFHDETQIEA